MSSIRSRRIFLRRVGEALSVYQLLEAVLKLCIQQAHLRIQQLVVGKVPFHYPPSEYKDAPLERLISMFQRHFDNKQLIERLRKAVKARNYIAHRIVEDYTQHRETRPRVAARISRDLKKLEEEGYDLVEELFKELTALGEAYDEDRLKSSMECLRLSSRLAAKNTYSAILRSRQATAKKVATK